MSEKTKLKYLKPFGPGILNGYLPKNILDNFVKISDDVISKKAQKWNYQLVGRIDDEWKIPDLLYKDYKIADYLDRLVYEYTKCFITDMKELDEYRDFYINDVDIKIKRGDGWINYMTESEYNPIHLHTHCTLSTIFYLDDYSGDEQIATKDSIDSNYGDKKNESEDGFTSFINGSFPVGEINPGPTRLNQMGNLLANFSPKTHFSVKPKKGMFFIFPSWLLHMVYPFRGKGKRVTASINYGVKLFLRKNK